MNIIKEFLSNCYEALEEAASSKEFVGCFMAGALGATGTLLFLVFISHAELIAQLLVTPVVSAICTAVCAIFADFGFYLLTLVLPSMLIGLLVGLKLAIKLPKPKRGAL